MFPGVLFCIIARHEWSPKPTWNMYSSLSEVSKPKLLASINGLLSAPKWLIFPKILYLATKWSELVSKDDWGGWCINGPLDSQGYVLGASQHLTLHLSLFFFFSPSQQMKTWFITSSNVCSLNTLPSWLVSGYSPDATDFKFRRDVQSLERMISQQRSRSAEHTGSGGQGRKAVVLWVLPFTHYIMGTGLRALHQSILFFTHSFSNYILNTFEVLYIILDFHHTEISLPPYQQWHL